jgi:hypothetical protein
MTITLESQINPFAVGDRERLKLAPIKSTNVTIRMEISRAVIVIARFLRIRTPNRAANPKWTVAIVIREIKLEYSKASLL